MRNISWKLGPPRDLETQITIFIKVNVSVHVYGFLLDNIARLYDINDDQRMLYILRILIKFCIFYWGNLT